MEIILCFNWIIKLTGNFITNNDLKHINILPGTLFLPLAYLEVKCQKLSLKFPHVAEYVCLKNAWPAEFNLPNFKDVKVISITTLIMEKPQFFNP